MKIRWAPIARRGLKEESGQVFVMTGLGALLLVGLAGIAIEVGHGYFALELLQASTNEATLAAATGLPSSTQATTNAQNYSSQTSEENAIGVLKVTSLTVTPYCSTTVANPNVYNVPCQAAAAGDASYNAVKVTQTATSSLWIGQMFGVPLFNLTAIGTAAMNGETCKLCNIAIIMDTTASMNDSDSSSDCTVSGTKTAETCALQGVRDLLSIAYPCLAGQTCTSGSATADDAVSLFVFPSITTATVSSDTTCPTSDPTVIPYTLPVSTGTDQIIPFTSGATYRTSDTSTGLNSGDALVNAAGGATDNCTGLRDPGGAATYYAQVIYAAGAALAAEQTARPGSKDVLIILTDGNATAGVDYAITTPAKQEITVKGASGAQGQCGGNGQPNCSDLIPSSPFALNGLAYNNPNSYTYPSAVGTCGQAVQAAYDVANKQTVTIGGSSVTLNNAGSYTSVYAVAYQSPTSYQASTSFAGGQCANDKPYAAGSNTYTSCTAATCTPTVANGGGSWPTPTSGETGINAYSPCAAIAAMASNPNYFFSDKGAGCPATTASNAGITGMQQIFTAIIDSLSSPKLIPLGTT